MRITTTMMSNNMLLNINRNMRNLNTLFNQMSSTKKIMLPSENPILAARSLKFRTNVSETKQYQQNTAQGLSWMEVSESAMYNTIEGGLKRIYELCNQASNDTNESVDRSVISKEIEELLAHMQSSMNATYAGRYVFSGYRTDQPPVFNVPNNYKYEITQEFSISNIEKTKSYQKNENEIPDVNNVNILKLAYKTTSTPILVDASNPNNKVPYSGTVIKVNPTDSNAYKPKQGEVHFIAETGELIFHDNDVSSMPKNLEVTYEKEGFSKGELNPLVYFKCKDMNSVSYIQSQKYVFTENMDHVYNIKENLNIDSSVFNIVVNPNGAYNINNIQPNTKYNIPDWSGNTLYDLRLFDASGNINFTTVSNSDPNVDVDNLQPNDVYYIKETGEFVFGSNYANKSLNVSYTSITKPAWGGNNPERLYVTYENSAGGTINNGITLDPETGNLIFSDDLINALTGNGASSATVTVKYDTVDKTTPGLNAIKLSYNGNISNLTITNKPDPGLNVIVIDDPANIGKYPPLDENTIHFYPQTGEIVYNDDAKIPIDGLQVSYDKQGFKAGTVNPEKIKYNVTEVTAKLITPPYEYDMENQFLEYEFATGTRIAVNSLSKDILTDKLYSDLRSLLDIVYTVKPSNEAQLTEMYKGMGLTGDELAKAVENQLLEESQRIQGVLQTKFSNMLKLINDQHLPAMNKEHTNIGTRMNRLELIQERLDQDLYSYEKLLSDNEDVNMAEVAMRYSAAQAVYNASLQAAATVIQMTLANFIS